MAVSAALPRYGVLAAQGRCTERQQVAQDPEALEHGEGLRPAAEMGGERRAEEGRPVDEQDGVAGVAEQGGEGGPRHPRADDEHIDIIRRLHHLAVCRREANAPSRL